MQIATVKVVNKDAKNGYMIINESDFEKGKHELFKEKAKKPAPKKAVSKSDDGE